MGCVSFSSDERPGAVPSRAEAHRDPGSENDSPVYLRGDTPKTVGASLAAVLGPAEAMVKPLDRSYRLKITHVKTRVAGSVDWRRVASWGAASRDRAESHRSVRPGGRNS